MRTIRSLIAAAALTFMTTGVQAADVADPAAQVAKLHDALLDIMKRSQELGYQGRFAAIEPVVNETFDFPAIGRIVMGKHWAGLAESEQKGFLETFARLSVATYASRFDGWDGESFRTVENEKQNENNALVKTELVKGNGETVSLNYQLRTDTDGKWRILNVVADGISDLSLKRAEYTSIMSSDGYAALMAKLNAKIAQYEADGAATAGSGSTSKE
jgi:phospholipid transport system substrate-binding protein